MKVVFSNRAYAAVLAETTEKIQTETGGLFLGTVQDDTWYIIEAIDPGPKSVFEIAYFEYDRKYTEHLINKIANLYEKKLSLIGLWHRHPGSFDQFSSTDDGTNAKYAAMRKEGAISALVNIDPEFRITMYQVNRPCRYSKISYEVGDERIPGEYLKFKTPEQYFKIMKNMMQPRSSRRSAVGGYHKTVSLASFMKLVLPQIRDSIWEEAETNNLLSNESTQEALIDEIVDDLTFMGDSLGIEMVLSMDSHHITLTQETVDKTTKLQFMVSVVKDSSILSYGGKHYLYRRGLLTEAYEKAKEEKDAEAAAQQSEKQPGIFNSVIKMIRFKRNEE